MCVRSGGVAGAGVAVGVGLVVPLWWTLQLVDPAHLSPCACAPHTLLTPPSMAHLPGCTQAAAEEQAARSAADAEARAAEGAASAEAAAKAAAAAKAKEDEAAARAALKQQAIEQRQQLIAERGIGGSGRPASPPREGQAPSSQVGLGGDVGMRGRQGLQCLRHWLLVALVVRGRGRWGTCMCRWQVAGAARTHADTHTHTGHTHTPLLNSGTASPRPQRALTPAAGPPYPTQAPMDPNEAAAHIQAAYRGHEVRRELAAHLAGQEGGAGAEGEAAAAAPTEESPNLVELPPARPPTVVRVAAGLGDRPAVLNAVFDQLDTNGSGAVDRAELRTALDSMVRGWGGWGIMSMCGVKGEGPGGVCVEWAGGGGQVWRGLGLRCGGCCCGRPRAGGAPVPPRHRLT